MLFWIVLFVLIFSTAGTAPAWPHSRRWGYSPSATFAVLLIIFMCLWMFGGLASWGHQSWWGDHHMMQSQP